MKRKLLVRIVVAALLVSVIPACTMAKQRFAMQQITLAAMAL